MIEGKHQNKKQNTNATPIKISISILFYVIHYFFTSSYTERKLKPKMMEKGLRSRDLKSWV